MSLPSPQQLRYLVAVADTLHFGEAAAVCGISQPALSSQLARLEQQLGARLIERTTRRVLMTPLGEQVAQQARRVLAELETLVSTARTEQSLLTGPMFLGVIPTVAPYALPGFLPIVRARFPELQLYLREDQTDRLIHELSRGKIDVALLALPVTVPNVEAMAVMEEPFLALLPRSHPLAVKKRLRQKDLQGSDVLLLEEGHCLRDQALLVCQSAGARESAAIRANSVSTLVQMVAGGLGITLLPESAIATELRGMQDVMAIPFQNPVPRRTVGLLWRSSSPRRNDFIAFGRLISTFLSEKR